MKVSQLFEDSQQAKRLVLELQSELASEFGITVVDIERIEHGSTMFFTIVNAGYRLEIEPKITENVHTFMVYDDGLICPIQLNTSPLVKRSQRMSMCYGVREAIDWVALITRSLTTVRNLKK